MPSTRSAFIDVSAVRSVSAEPWLAGARVSSLEEVDVGASGFFVAVVCFWEVALIEIGTVAAIACKSYMTGALKRGSFVIARRVTTVVLISCSS